MKRDLVLRDRFYTKYNGEEILRCIQCGTCSGSCPLAAHMDFGPRRLFAMIREGDMMEALRSNTIWYCVSCYNCAVSCPRQIAVTDHIYSLRILAASIGIKPPEMLDLYRSFAVSVERYGRINDISVMAGFAFKHPELAFSSIPLGMKLLAKKRLALKKDSVENPRAFNRVMRTAGP